jgi:hypothetical protein
MASLAAGIPSWLWLLILASFAFALAPDGVAAVVASLIESRSVLLVALGG